MIDHRTGRIKSSGCALGSVNMASFNNSHEAVRFLRGLPPHSQPTEPPRTYQEYVHGYGANRHDTFISKYQDRSVRDPAVSSFDDLTAEQIVLILTRSYEQVK